MSYPIDLQRYSSLRVSDIESDEENISNEADEHCNDFPATKDKSHYYVLSQKAPEEEVEEEP